jgi:hypothetical protein
MCELRKLGMVTRQFWSPRNCRWFDVTFTSCYFHLVRGRVTLPDEEGIELPDDDWEREIFRIIEEIRSEAPALFQDASGWTIQVVDEQGRELTRFPL